MWVNSDQRKPRIIRGKWMDKYKCQSSKKNMESNTSSNIRSGKKTRFTIEELQENILDVFIHNKTRTAKKDIGRTNKSKCEERNISIQKIIPYGVHQNCIIKNHLHWGLKKAYIL